MLLENLEIQSVEVHGKGVARNNGKVVFVENALPGEKVDAEVFQKKKGYAFARPVAFHQQSPERQQPFCTHFGVCGGCTWQNASYKSQLEFKRQFVVDAFQRIGKLQFPEVPAVIGCANTTYYRNKLEFTFSNKNWLTKEEMEEGLPFAPALGFHKPGLFDKVVDIKECHLQREPSNKIRLALKEFAVQEGIPFFDLRKQEGFLRNLIIRTSSLGELLVIVSFFSNDLPTITKVMDFLKNRFGSGTTYTERNHGERSRTIAGGQSRHPSTPLRVTNGSGFPEITSLNYVINPKANDAINDQEVINYSGQSFIREKLGGIEFHIGPKSFFQVNVEQAKNLFDVAMEFAGLNGKELVYDLYCGIGSISLYAAGRCRKIVGIEQLEDAVKDARHNAELNGIINCEFLAGDVGKLLSEEFLSEKGKPDVIFIDPPRAGMHPKLIKTLLEVQADKIIYVSCNPATQARDLADLSHKYQITKVQPVDMFPQTYHIENVAALKLVW